MGVLSSKTWILLKKIFCLSTIFFLFIVMNSCNFQRKSEIDLIFEQTKKIEILAYLDRNQWKKEDNEKYYSPVNYIKDKKIEINEKYLKNKIVLNSNQINKLKEELMNSKVENWEAACYDPRHAIIFYDNKNEVFGYVELCFDCNGSYYSPNMEIISKPALRQEKLFKEFGITYFNE
jgi:hypothetical protein